MSASCPIALFCLFALAAVPARAQGSGSDPDALKASVLQVLSLATFGMVSTDDQQATVTQDGSDYRVRLKLSGFQAPADAAITAVARPLDHGRVGIQSMAFPSSGTVETTQANGLINRISFTLGRQTISAKVDPSLSTESSYAADFGDVRLRTAQGEQRGEQTFDHIAADGTFSAGPDGRLTFVAQSRGTGFHMIGHGPNDFESDTSARAIAGHFAVEGLDRAQGARLLAAFRGLVAADPQARSQSEPAPAAGASAEQRRQLGAMLDAANGLLKRVKVDETMEQIHFAVGTAAGSGAGTIGSLRLTMAGDALQDRVNTRMGIVADGIAMPAMEAASSGLIPRHFDLKTVLGGVPVQRLMALLRAAAQQHADPMLLQTQAMGLLGDRDARVAIESLSFDAGPLSVLASARLLPGANGQLGGTIHIAARGVDALLAKAQSQPKLQQALPVIFMAKGMGRAQGDSLVWDIALGDGPPTINGTPFGQPTGKTR